MKITKYSPTTYPIGNNLSNYYITSLQRKNTRIATLYSCCKFLEDILEEKDKTIQTLTSELQFLQTIVSRTDETT